MTHVKMTFEFDTDAPVDEAMVRAHFPEMLDDYLVPPEDETEPFLLASTGGATITDLEVT